MLTNSISICYTKVVLNNKQVKGGIAVVVIENMYNVPDNCLICPLSYYDEYLVHEEVCPLLNNSSVEDYCINRSKPSSCPLKEVK